MLPLQFTSLVKWSSHCMCSQLGGERSRASPAPGAAAAAESFAAATACQCDVKSGLQPFKTMLGNISPHDHLEPRNRPSKM